MAKIVFMGSPAFAVPSLRALHTAGHEIVAVYSQPPRPAGRGQKLQKTAVHEAADELGLAVFTPEKLRGADLDFVMGLEAEVFCVVGFGMLLPKALVDSRICLNVHPSALPRWRGPTPVQSALMAGDKTTDVCIMRLEYEMDAGPVYDRTPVVISEAMTMGQLNDIVWSIGAERLVEVVANVQERTPVPQVGEAVRCFKITAETRVIDWQKTANDIHNQIRGLSPKPAATGKLGTEVFKTLLSETCEGTGEAGEIVGIDDRGMVVACGEGALRLLEIQRPGGKAGRAMDVVRGWAEMKVGARLT